MIKQHFRMKNDQKCFRIREKCIELFTSSLFFFSLKTEPLLKSNKKYFDIRRLSTHTIITIPFYQIKKDDKKKQF